MDILKIQYSLSRDKKGCGFGFQISIGLVVE